MKIRSGFVSNSSSSSFIVGFKKRPMSAGEVHEILFGKEPAVLSVYNYGYPTTLAAQRVFDDIQKQLPATKEQIKEVVRSGYYEDRPGYQHKDRPSEVLANEFRKKFPIVESYWDSEKITDPEAREMAVKICTMRQAEWAEDSRLNDEAADRYTEKQLPKFAGCEVYLFSYADDGGESVLEHGDIFHNLPHVVVSNH